MPRKKQVLAFRNRTPEDDEILLPSSDYDFVILATLFLELIERVQESLPENESKKIIDRLGDVFLNHYTRRLALWREKYPKLRGRQYHLNPGKNSLRLLPREKADDIVS